MVVSMSVFQYFSISVFKHNGAVGITDKRKPKYMLNTLGQYCHMVLFHWHNKL